MKLSEASSPGEVLWIALGKLASFHPHVTWQTFCGAENSTLYVKVRGPHGASFTTLHRLFDLDEAPSFLTMLGAAMTYVNAALEPGDLAFETERAIAIGHGKEALQ